MDTPAPEKIIEHLSEFISEARRERLKTILQQRTRHITVVLEDIYQAQNASAVVRTCECFGIQEIHVIENQHPYQLNPAVVQGASKWIELNRYNQGNEDNEDEDNAGACINRLKERGYRIIAMTPEQNSQPIKEIGIDKKLALCFGSEEPGLSGKLMGLADETANIPIHGLTQSYNLSVSAAISLYELTGRLKNSSVNWGLDEADMTGLYIEWLAKSTPAGEALLRKYRQETSGE